MNQPIPIQEKHLRFSLAQLPMDKALGYLFCLVQSNRKLTILAGIILIIGAVSIIYALYGENSEWIELRNLNRQASQMIYQNQPEEAIVIYDRIQEHLSHLKSNKMTRKWTRRMAACPAVRARRRNPAHDHHRLPAISLSLEILSGRLAVTTIRPIGCI
jgi:hypothetical protein